MSIVSPLVYDVPRAAEALCISRTSLYELIRSKRLKTIKVGGRRLVPASCLEEFLAQEVSAA